MSAPNSQLYKQTNKRICQKVMKHVFVVVVVAVVVVVVVVVNAVVVWIVG